MSKLLSRLKKASTVDGIDTLEDSRFFRREQIPTDIPLLNIALSGETDGGLSEGILMVAGESRTFKTGFLIQMVKAHQAKYKDSTTIFFDSEFSPVEYWEKQGIEMDQVLHVPVTSVEELKINAAKMLAEITEDDNVIIIIDSIGGLASAKEAQDAEDGKSTTDMTRAKALNSFFRIVTPKLNMLGIPLCLINSHYETQEMYSKVVIAGGKKSFLSADDVWFISRAQDKDGKELLGYNFTIRAEKSRTVKEGSKFPINVTWENGIDKYSGIFELAVEAGIIVQSGAWYQTVDADTGEISEKKKRRKEIECPEFLAEVLANETFKEYVKEKYIL